MTYDTQAQNKFANNVVELIVFRTGLNNYIYTSTHTEELIIDGNTYLPFPFDRGERRVNNAFEDDGVKIIVLPNHPICDHFKTMPTDYDVSVLVRQGYLDDAGVVTAGSIDTDYPILCLGWIGSVEFDAESGQMTISVISVGDTLAAPSLSRHYQQSCPLRLYGPKCGAVRKFVTVVPVSMGTGQMMLPANWHLPHEPHDFIGGLISFIQAGHENQYRMIARAFPDKLIFVGSSQNLDTYDSVQLALGCSHVLDSCRDLHDNSRRYGGFPWQPLENPVMKSIR